MPRSIGIRPPILNPIMPPQKASKRDLGVAQGLKQTISTQTIKLALTEAKNAPKLGANGQWTTAKGDALIRVQLSGKPPAGSADFPTSFALVNPNTNEYFRMQAGGITGKTFAYGPAKLPAGQRFEQALPYTPAQLKQLQAAAKKGETQAPAVKLPKARDIEAAMGAYNFHNMHKYSSKKPTGAIAAEVKLKGDNHPDGFNYTALVLKSDPRKVIIERTGGFAGTTSYSNVIDLNRIPK